MPRYETLLDVVKIMRAELKGKTVPSAFIKRRDGGKCEKNSRTEVARLQVGDPRQLCPERHRYFLDLCGLNERSVY